MPSLPENEQSCNTHLAALVAINIVTQVLDEAEDILITAHDSGQPWRCVWRQKKGYGEFYENPDSLGALDSKFDENDTNNCNTIQNDSVIITSTPQKEIAYISTAYNENGFIGQGDEDIQMRTRDLRSPSLLINCLFDMSEVEQAETTETSDDVQFDSESRDLIPSFVAKLIESHVNLAVNTVCGDAVISEHEVMLESIEDNSNSSYSFLSDAFVNGDTEIDKTAFYVHDDKEGNEHQCTATTDHAEDVEKITKKEIDLFEKTFLTLNRDYEKYSDEDFLPDGKSFVMQEVELLTDKSENLASLSNPTYILKQEEERSTATDGIHKNSLVQRCRLQGSKLMSRIRSWWWKQRLFGRRKGCRLGQCPVSSKSRNIAASLMDHRQLRSPSPMRAAAWKFNTVNEALIHSYNMKEFDLGLNSSDPMENY